MNVFVHGAVGAAAGSLTGSPVLALPAGLASHIPLDVVPHYDFEDVRLDVALLAVVAAGLALAGAATLPVMLGLLGGALPDLENLHIKLGLLAEEERRWPTHSGLLPHGRLAARGPSLALQVLLVALAVAVALAARR